MKRLLSWRLVQLALLLAVLGVVAIYLMGTYVAQYGDGDRVEIAFGEDPDLGGSAYGLLLGRSNAVLQSCCDHSLETVPDPAGGGGTVAKLTAKTSDPHVKGNIRSEIRLLSNPLGADSWYRVQVYVPGDWQVSPTKVLAMQWHASKDFFIGEKGRVPPLEITIEGDEWHFQKAFDGRLRSSGNRGNVERIDDLGAVPLETGRWIDWVIYARWSYSSDGKITIWKDGTKVVEDTGANAHRDLVGPYIKAGVYVPQWGYQGSDKGEEERSLLFKTVEMAQGEDPFGMLKPAQ